MTIETLGNDLGRDRKALRLPHAPMPSAHSSYRQGSGEPGVAIA